MPECFDEVNYDHDDFKRFEKKIKKFVDELRITKVVSSDCFYNTVILGIFSNLSDFVGEKKMLFLKR